MIDWSMIALGVIAMSTGVMALIQIGACIYGAQLARRVNRLADRVEREIDPLMAKVQEMSSDATRATKLAAAQVERADQLTSRLSRRVEETLDVAQQVLVAPARQALALLDGIRAALSRRDPPRPAEPDAAPAKDENDALFIG